MENVAGVRARAEANIVYSIERLFIVAALLALSLTTYVIQGGSVVVRAPARALLFIPSIYALCGIVLLLASIAVRMNGSARQLRTLSFLQITLDLLILPVAALLSGGWGILIFFILPVVGSAGLFHSRAPVSVSLVASFMVLIVSLGEESVVALPFLSPFIFVSDIISLPLPLPELIFILALIIAGGSAAGYGRALHDRAALLAAPRMTRRESVPPPTASEVTDHEETARVLQSKEYEVERANARLSGLDRAKSDFISVATHQLRTPLAGIKWTFESLLQGNPNPNEQELLEKGSAATERMVRIVNEILSIDKIEHERFEVSFEYIDPVTLVESSVVEFQAPAIGKGVHLTFNKPTDAVPLVELDVDKVRMVLDNLIENAIKYTVVGGTILVALNTARVNAAHAVIELVVKDSGIGISEKAQHDIFTKFYRASNAKRAEPNGSGLGLYIAKTIVEAHHGSIWFESEEGKGTEFHVELPVHQST